MDTIQLITSVKKKNSIQNTSYPNIIIWTQACSYFHKTFLLSTIWPWGDASVNLEGIKFLEQPLSTSPYILENIAQGKVAGSS